MQISIHHSRREPVESWCHTCSDGRGWRTIAEATADAIECALWLGSECEGLSGHADRSLLRAAGIRYIDSRGSSRKSATSRAKAKANMDRRINAMRHEAERQRNARP